MTTLTLFVKAANPKQLRQVDDLLTADLCDLDLEVTVLGNPVNKWVQVSLSGEDEPIATNYVTQKIGTCPTNIKNVEKFSVLKGYFSKIDVAKQQLVVDVGIFEPRVIHATISLEYLQAQLADGRKIELKRLMEVYGFREGLILSVKISGLSEEVNGDLQAEFSIEQLERIRLWQQSLLDRLIILGASLSEIETMLERARLNRDIIGIETLGMFEHTLTCKLGTDAAGIVSKVGRYMRNSVFIVYNPKKVLGFIAETALTL
jgi:hypothetical protein